MTRTDWLRMKRRYESPAMQAMERARRAVEEALTLDFRVDPPMHCNCRTVWSER